MMQESPTFANPDLLLSLQQGLPLTERPFQALGQILGLEEAVVVAEVKAMVTDGLIRRIGGIFNSAGLGYCSLLCAAQIPPRDLPALAGAIGRHPGVTHSYAREGSPNYWFTLTENKPALEATLTSFETLLEPIQLYRLPAEHRFKTRVVLDPARADGQSALPREDMQPTTLPLSAREKGVVRSMAGHLPVQADFFSAVARQNGYELPVLLSLLQTWQEAGVLRRVAAVLYHRKAGFRANGLCAWDVPDRDVVAKGRQLAASPQVTHCYARPRCAIFPFNLYAMVHGKEEGVARSVFETLSLEVGPYPSTMRLSVREFKKSSPVFFPTET